MKNDEKTFEAYFSGMMTSSEAIAFNTLLENDTVIKEDYNHFLAVKKASNLIERDKMRAKLDEIEVKNELTNDEPEKKPTIPILTIMKWVGGVAAIFLIAFFTFNSLNKLSPQEFYAQNFEIYNVQVARGGTSDELISTYNEGNFELFLNKALQLEDAPELNMMIANAYMKSGQYPEAIKTLTKISDDSSLRDKKYWYLGLNYLKVDKIEEAIKNFKYLISISNFKKTETEEILSIIVK